MLDGVFNLISNKKNCYSSHEESFFIIFTPRKARSSEIAGKIRRIFCGDTLPYLENIEISLSKDPVLTFPWEPDRLTRALGRYGAPNAPWAEDTSNHQLTLIQPIGLSIVRGGNHSIFSGLLKRDGIVTICKKSSHKIIDISPLYELLRFDGVNYLFQGTNKIVGEAASFEFGCIFEIGRLLHEKGIAFKMEPFENILTHRKSSG